MEECPVCGTPLPRRQAPNLLNRFAKARPTPAPLESPVTRIEAEIRGRFGRTPAFFEPALASPEVLRELWRQTRVEWLESAVPDHFRYALVEALADHSPWPWAAVADAIGSPTGAHVDAAAVLNGVVSRPASEERLLKWPDPDQPEWHELLGLTLRLVVDGPDEEVRARLLALLGDRRYADLVATISYLETCRMFAQAHPGLSAAASSRFRRTADPKRLAVIELDLDGAIVSFSPAAEQLFAHRAEGVAKTSVTDLFDADSAASLRRLVEEYAAEEGGPIREQSIPIVGQRRDGSSFVAALSLSNRGRAGETGVMTAIVTPEPARTWSDHAAAYRLLLSLLEGGASTLPPQAVLDAIAQALGWEYVLVWRWDSDEGVLRCAAMRSLAGELPAEVEARAERSWKRGEGLAGTVLRSGTPGWAGDLAQTGAEELMSGLWLPLGSNGEVDGVLELLSTAKREPDGALLTMLSNLVGDAVSAPDLAREPAADVRHDESSDDVDRAHLAFEGAPLGLALVTMEDGRAATVAQANRALGVITRRAHDELVGTDFRDITFADDVDLDAELLGQLIAGRIPSYVIGKRMVRPDGEVFWAELSVALIRADDATHEPVYLVVQVADITERKRVEDALQLSRERMATVFDEAPIGMALATLDGRWLQVNEALCRTFGYSEKELLAKPLRELIAEEEVDTIIRYLRQVLAGEVVGYHVETRAVRSGDEVVWVLLSVSLIHDYEGAPAYLLAEVQDISERKRLEEELEQGAFLEPVTGLPSRALLFDRLDQACQRLARTGTPFAVMFVLADGFEAVEARFGAERAATALREVAARLIAAVRAGDTVARYGADEFVVVCEDLESNDEAGAIVQRIIDFGQFEVGAGENALDLSVTVGVTIAADAGDSPAGLVERADAAMQAARGGGQASQEYCDSL